jgi:hypothetical protein
VVNGWLLVAGRWSQVAGSWSLDPGRWIALSGLRLEVGGLNILPFSLKPQTSGLKPRRRLPLSRVGYCADQQPETRINWIKLTGHAMDILTILKEPLRWNQN